jgi:hypothetical protein
MAQAMLVPPLESTTNPVLHQSQSHGLRSDLASSPNAAEDFLLRGVAEVR